MYSRAHLLIERDFERLQKENLWGIEAGRIKEDNIFEWSAKVLGLKGTPWEGGVFQLYIKFDEHYNARPPKVFFHTIPFHPNVDMVTGRPCIDFLDDVEMWQSSYRISHVLLAVQALLSNPVLDNPVNIQAMHLLQRSPRTYRQMVQDCVAASHRVQAGFVPPQSHEDQIYDPTQDPISQVHNEQTVPMMAVPPATSGRRVAKVSFEDYHATWCGIATSKSDPEMKNPLLENIRDNPVLLSAHYGLPVQEMQVQMDRQLQEHSNLVYGRFRDKPKMTEEEIQQAKLEKINQMRKIYLQPKGSRKTPISLGPEQHTMTGRTEDIDHWDEEADDLVKWTNNLNADAL